MSKDARQRAWTTRRAKYGPKGHSGYAYSHTLAVRQVNRRVLEEIDVARRHCQILLPAKAAHKAIDHIDFAIRMLEGV